jgi:hypothetical protein
VFEFRKLKHDILEIRFQEQGVPMTDANSPRYRHTQTGPWYLLLCASAVLMLVVGWLSRSEPVVPAMLPTIFLATGAGRLRLGACFQHLTVADEGDRLAVRFGPLPLFRKRIR